MTKPQAVTLYKERLVPGFSFYLATLFIPVALFLIVLAFDDFWALVALIAAEILIIGISIGFAPSIRVQNGTLFVGRAMVPIVVLGDVSIIARKDAFLERGPNLDIKSFVRFQIGVNSLVKIKIDDPKDPTPYWLVATRRPKELVHALTADG